MWRQHRVRQQLPSIVIARIALQSLFECNQRLSQRPACDPLVLIGISVGQLANERGPRPELYASTVSGFRGSAVRRPFRFGSEAMGEVVKEASPL